MNTHLARFTRTALATVTATLLLQACAKQDLQGANARVPEVGFLVMAPQRLTLGTQLPGRTVAFRIAQVRPQVSGIIKQRLYTEGANVAAGQALYALDAAPFKAAYDSAQAAVAKADANELTVRLRFERYQKLAASGDVSQQMMSRPTSRRRRPIRPLHAPHWRPRASTWATRASWHRSPGARVLQHSLKARW